MARNLDFIIRPTTGAERLEPPAMPERTGPHLPTGNVLRQAGNTIDAERAALRTPLHERVTERAGDPVPRTTIDIRQRGAR